jgi:hypothetical protein
MSFSSLPAFSVEPVEHWATWNVVRAARVDYCGNLHFVGYDPASGLVFVGGEAKKCYNLDCPVCGTERVGLLVKHCFQILVPEERVWMNYLASRDATVAVSRNLAQRARRENKRREANELPIEWGCFNSWDGTKVFVATADLSDRAVPATSGGWVTGARSFDLLSRTVLRVGVLDHWPSFRRGGRWQLLADRTSAAPATGAEALGQWAPPEIDRRFSLAADEAERRWGYRPIRGCPPHPVPRTEWRTLLRVAFGKQP